MRILSFLLLLGTAFISPVVLSSPKKLAEDRTIVLGGPITDRALEPFMSTMDKLVEADDDAISIVLSSPGGSVVTGSLMIDKIEQVKASGVRVNCYVRDLAASMAFQILLHCSERYATPHSFLLWHPVRIFLSQVVMTGTAAEVLAVQLKLADSTALADLKDNLPLREDVLMWHFNNETLHQGMGLAELAPTFFNKVTNNISGLYPKKPALDTTSIGGFFGARQIVYIHERFITRGMFP